MFLVRRRKGIFSLFLLASFIIFCTWLMQFKFNDQQHHHHHQIANDDTNLNEKNIVDVELNHRHHHDRMLLLAKTLTIEAQQKKQRNDDNDQKAEDFKLSRLNKFADSNVVIDEEISKNEQEEANTELQNLFKFLHHINAFIADIDILNEILRLDNNLIDFEITFEYFKRILKQKNNLLIQVTFGINPNAINLNDLTEKNHLKSHYDLNCKIIQVDGSLNENKIATQYYLNCKYVKIQLAIFYNRNEFLWIGKHETNLNEDLVPKWFGDVARAMQKVNVTLGNTKASGLIFIPSNIKKFLFDYNVSKFIECNRSMAEYNVRVIGDSYKQNLNKNKMLLPVMTHIASTLEGLEKHFWLAGGTLLGWYRDCGIIPHTQDVDFAIWSHEYDTRIKKAFLGNKIVRVWGTLGLVNDSFEFRMYNDLFTFDMFLVYNHNETYNWCGYQVNKVKFRRWLPKFNELCSAELLSHKFMIPCDPVAYLNKEYGKQEKWITPQATNYTWSNVNHWKSWSDDEWPHVIKYYDKNGSLLKPKILSYLNKHSKKNITEVPDDPY